MKKWSVLIICLTFFMFLAAACSAETISGACGENAVFTLDENGRMEISGSGKMWDFRNDAEYFDYHECPWSDYKQDIRQVVFKGNITRVGADSFCFCEELKSVRFSDSITEIGEFSFWYCSQLSSITLPAKLESLYQQAFANTALEEVEIPGSVCFLDACAFEFCEHLTKVIIRKNAGGTYIIGNSPFRGCTALKAIEVENGHSALYTDQGVLYSANNLIQYPCGKEAKEYTVKAGCECIMSFAFETAKLIEIVYLPETMEAIYSYAFEECKSLTYIKIPDTVRTIMERAFDVCPNLQSIRLSENVSDIGDYAFDHSTLLIVPEGSYAARWAQENGYDLQTFKTTDIADTKIASIKNQTYTGKKITPEITIKHNGKKLVKDKDYTLSYKNNKAIGAATVTITGKGDYKGTVTKEFKIIPKPVTLSSLKAGSKKLTVKWKKGSGITGYQIQYSINSSFEDPKKITVEDAKTVSTVIKKLTKGKTYYVRIRAYKTVKGKKYYSKWSKVLNKKVK